MEVSQRYALSFTFGGLLVRESLLTVQVWNEERDWVQVRSRLMQSNELHQRTMQSNRTVSREVVGRLSQLSDAEMELIGNGSPQDREHVLWIAACRRYELLAEFAEEVVRERFLLLTPLLDLADFDGFLRAKSVWHDELDHLSDSTRKKLRQNAFRMLREADLVSEDGLIQRALLSSRLEALLNVDGVRGAEFFPAHLRLRGAE